MARLGVGVAALGRPGYINLGHGDDLSSGRSVEEMEARCHSVLDAAWAAGVRHLDAARSYGLGERFVGSWLASHPGRRGEITLGSKWGYTYVADWRVDVDVHEVKDHSLATFERQWPETLEALGGPPDLYLIHSLTPESPALGDAALLDALRALAGQGVRVGFSTSGPQQRDVIRRALELADSPFSAVQSTWNCLEPSAGPALAEAKQRGWHVVVKEGVANGRLTARGDPPAAVARLAAEHGVTPDAIALAHALAQPVDVVLSGASSIVQLRQNLVAADVSLSPDDLADLATAAGGDAVAGGGDGGTGGGAGDPSAYWSHRSSLPWH